MAKGHKRYHAAPWSSDYDPKKKGGVAPWHRKRDDKKKGAGKAPWSSSFRDLRGGGR